MVPPGESILRRMFGCVGTAIARRCHCCCAKKVEHDEDNRSSASEGSDGKKKKHWLDYAAPDYDKQFISDVKDVLRVAWLFLPLPVFWALFDQQGSRWTLQATQMNGDVGGFIVLPDLIQVINPLIIVVFVPIFESIIYPCLNKIRIPHRPLQRMTAGMIMAATAFILAAILQMGIDKDFPPEIPSGQTKFQFVNPSSCSVSIRNVGEPDSAFTVDSLNLRDYQYIVAGDVTFEVTWTQSSDCSHSLNHTVTFEQGKAYQLFTDQLAVYQYTQDRLEQTGGSQSAVRFYNALTTNVSLSMKTVNENQESTPRELGVVYQQNLSIYEEIILADYEVTVKWPFAGSDHYNISMPLTKHIFSQNGAVYIVILHNDTTTPTVTTITQLTEIHPWSLSIFLQVPQYFVITIGEILFSITGLSFAYTQAAPSMKSILTAIWLMTVAIGNLVVVIVAESGSAMSQVDEFFLFAGLMYGTTIIFIIMTYFYTYVDRNDWATEESSLEQKVGEDNFALDIRQEKINMHDYEDIENRIDNDSKEKNGHGQDDEGEYFDERL